MSAEIGVRAQAVCQVVRDRDFTLLGERASHISWEGMFLESKEEVEIGEDVIVSLRAPRSGKWLDAVARVTRTVPLSDDGSIRGVGLRFQRMDRPSRAVLRTMLGPPRKRSEDDFAAVRKPRR